jgi:hypothetical protein
MPDVMPDVTLDEGVPRMGYEGVLRMVQMRNDLGGSLGLQSWHLVMRILLLELRLLSRGLGCLSLADELRVATTQLGVGIAEGLFI